MQIHKLFRRYALIFFDWTFFDDLSQTTNPVAANVFRDASLKYLLYIIRSFVFVSVLYEVNDFGSFWPCMIIISK